MAIGEVLCNPSYEPLFDTAMEVINAPLWETSFWGDFTQFYETVSEERGGWPALTMGRPSTAIMMSPRRSPAFSAEEPGTTSATIAPDGLSACMAVGIAPGWSWIETPSWPRLTLPDWANCSATCRTMLLGMAKPMPMLPPAGPTIAVLIPTR